MITKNNHNSTTSQRLPPLNALRAFETAARHHSFAMAAKELHVTPAAISHQIKGLEDYLGQRLFRRLKSGLELTRAGQVLHPKLTEGFNRLGDAVEDMRAIEEGPLAVSAAPSFATRWLAPRLHRFVGAHPELDVRINASTRLIDPSRDESVSGDTLVGSPVDDADIVVRFGTGDYPGFRVDRLMGVAVTPMCSPRLLNGGHPLKQPADLKHHVLIHDNVRYDDGRQLWDAWFEAAGLPETDISHGLRFSHAFLALEAAADGMGVTMGMPALAGSDLASGRLVAPLALSLPLKFAYYVVSGSDTAERADVIAFRDWLVDEAARAPT